MIKRILFVCLTLTSLKIIAQRNNSSAYSFFGIGENANIKTVEHMSMGGIGVALSSVNSLNFINPAANANLRFTTYSIGGLLNNLIIKSNSNRQSGTSTSLSYLALGFPIGHKAGVSFGLQPESSVGYSLSNKVKSSNGKVTEEITSYKGNGGTTKLYARFGMFIAKDLSIGVEGDFVFGKIENIILKERKGVSLATKHNQVSSITGKSLKIGAQYKKELANKLAINLGIAMKLSNNLTLSTQESLYSLSISSLGQQNIKSILSNITIDNSLKNPLKTTFGVGLGKENKWYTGIECQIQNALNFSKKLNQQNNVYKYGDFYRVSLGGYYLPKINSISSYWNRVTYRGGLHFEKTGLLVDGTATGTNFTSINDFGISFGLGLPLSNRFSSINLGIEYGRKGTTKNNLIQENYFNFRLSLSFSDIWFRKMKID